MKLESCFLICSSAEKQPQVPGPKLCPFVMTNHFVISLPTFTFVHLPPVAINSTDCILMMWWVWRSAVDSLQDSKFWNHVHSFLLVKIKQYVMLNQYCLLSLSTKDCANNCFSSFAYWCEMKGLQLLPFELGCVEWQKYTFWMLDAGRRYIYIHVTDDLFSTVSLWGVKLFSVLAVVILGSSSLPSSIISVVESECCGERKWQRWSLDWQSEFVSYKICPFYLQIIHKKGKKGDRCTGEKTIHVDLHFWTLKELDGWFLLLLLVVVVVVVFVSLSLSFN